MLCLKRRWIICALALVLTFFVLMICWRYYRTNYVNTTYRGSGTVVGYERVPNGLIVELEVKNKPVWRKKRESGTIRLLIDNDTKQLFPMEVYAMKEGIVGYRIQFTTREFWLPDARKNDEYVYPLFGCVMNQGEWYDLTKSGKIDETEYTEFEEIYSTKSDSEWLGIS